MNATREATYDTIHESQQHFRALLDATARPGTLIRFSDAKVSPPPTLNKASALVGLALLDADASFYTSNESSSHYLQTNTHSVCTDAEDADFLFLYGQRGTEEAQRAKIGTARYPEGGATLIIDIDRIDGELGIGAMALVLKGPGIDGERTVYTWGLPAELLVLRMEKNDEFPAGIDWVLSDVEGVVCCLPRTTQIRWEQT
jgi:alpha-D-ribose 1-methylphosphonate 5-triphosphate synthase subunit PhnH